MESKNKIRASEISFSTEDGKKYNIPEEGSLGLLAFGYLGLMAWREKRKEAAKKQNIENQ